MKALKLVYPFRDTGDFVDYQTGEIYTSNECIEHDMTICASFDECHKIVLKSSHVWGCLCDDCLKMKG